MIKEYLYHKIEYGVSQLGFMASIMSLPSDFGNTILKNVVSLFFALLLFFITRYCKKRWPDKSNHSKSNKII